MRSKRQAGMSRAAVVAGRSRAGGWRRLRSLLSVSASVALLTAMCTVMGGGFAVLGGSPAQAATPSSVLGPPPGMCTGAFTDPPGCITQSGDGTVTVSPNLVEPGGSYTVTFTATPGAEQNDYLDDFAAEGAFASVSGETVGVVA